MFSNELSKVGEYQECRPGNCRQATRPNGYSHILPMHKTQCWKIGQFVMPQTCENLLGLVNSYVYYARQARGIYQVLPYSVDFKAPGELWDPLSKTVLSKCSFIWDKGLLNILNDLKAQMWFVRRTCKYFSDFYTNTTWEFLWHECRITPHRISRNINQCSERELGHAQCYI